ncbi:SGNH/GDSL hydrolase family protein [Candidatus Protofrankia californiensis]|uniref:SGNH/GDSL hydrolase family protein n=1 Tax=Candidatus Protofrankia californiensis TaxID=1839754 RepID=UPI001F497EBC|nr:SGNH/GDSL hydrolase family protein [Candidatus Protofrankia californiensis]
MTTTPAVPHDITMNITTNITTNIATTRQDTTTTCFVALGDSITAGLGDGVSMGRYRRDHAARALAGRGWAAMLAACLAPAGQVRFANLATTGATTRDVRETQIPVALALRPQIASLVAGMNDLLSPGFDPLRLRHNLVWSVRDLRAAGVLVLMARLHDPGRLLRLPRPARRLLTTRIGRLNAAVDAAAAADRGVLVIDLDHHPEAYRLSTFDVDRVHPGPRGHQLMARAFAEALREAGVPLLALPAVGPPATPSRLAHAGWMVSVGLPWLLARPASPLRRQVRRIMAGHRAGRTSTSRHLQRIVTTGGQAQPERTQPHTGAVTVHAGAVPALPGTISPLPTVDRM